jgi:hypothetical protein
MTQYLTSLDNIRHLFKAEIKNLHQQFKKEDITQALIKMDIFQNDEKSEYDNDISRIAWLVANRAYQNLKIEYKNDSPYNQWQCLTYHELLALDISNKKEVLLTTESILPVDETLQFTLTEQEIQFYQAENIDWEILGSNTNPWASADFVFEKIRQGMNPDEIYTYSDIKLWQDKEFIEQIFKYKPDILNRAPEFIALNNTIFDYAKEDPKLFHSMFMYHYSKACYDKVESPYSDKPENKLEKAIENGDEKKIEYLKWHIQKNKKIYTRIKNEIFSNKETLKNLLNQSERIYDYCPEEVRADKELAKLYVNVSLKVSNGSVWGMESNIPQSVFADDEFMEFYIKTALSRSPNFKNSDAYQSWLDNKEKLLKFLPMTDITDPKKDKESDPLLFIFNKIDKKLKRDVDLMTLCLKKDAHLYTRLSEQMREVPELVKLYIVNEPYTSKYASHIERNWIMEKNLEKIPLSFIQNLDISKDMNTIVTLVKSVPQLLLSDNCPSLWLDSPEIVACAGKYFGQMIDQKKIAQEMIDKISDLEAQCQYLISQNTDNYFLLNYEAQSNENNLLELIDNVYSLKEEQWAKVPPEALCSQKIWFRIIRQGDKKAPQIPEAFWQDKNFILQVAKLIDEEKLSLDFLNKGPSKIAQLLEQGKPKKKEYFKFFEKMIASVKLHTEILGAHMNEDEEDDIPKLKI